MQVIYACDIGTTRGPKPKFAWVRMKQSRPKICKGSHDIEELAQHLAEDMKKGFNIALGFEAPLFIPIPMSANDLSKARIGEGNRAFAAPTGLAVTTLAIHQTAWLLDRLRTQIPENYHLTLDWHDWGVHSKGPILFLWEAFVSGDAHSLTDMEDAATAAAAFCEKDNDFGKGNRVTCYRALSLIGTAILWSGISKDLAFLKNKCLVIKPDVRIECSIAAT